MSKRVEELDRKIAALQQQRRDAVVRERKQNRKFETHEKIVGMGIVHEVVGGDWTCVDIEAWNAYVHRYADRIREAVKRKPITPDAANEEVREFERRKREAKKENRRIIEKALEKD